MNGWQIKLPARIWALAIVYVARSLGVRLRAIPKSAPSVFVVPDDTLPDGMVGGYNPVNHSVSIGERPFAFGGGEVLAHELVHAAERSLTGGVAGCAGPKGRHTSPAYAYERRHGELLANGGGWQEGYNRLVAACKSYLED